MDRVRELFELYCDSCRSKRLFSSASDRLYIISTLAIFLGLVLSFVSWLNICTKECESFHYYRLFGMPFEYTGLIFFSLLFINQLLLLRYPSLVLLAGILLATGLGAETLFLMIQKFHANRWCPVCLSIASTICIASIAYIIAYSKNIDKGGKIMQLLKQGKSVFTCLFLGFIIAFLGTSKVDQLQAAENNVKNNLVFGNKTSPIDVYIFTDWKCTACRHLDPVIADMAPSIMKEARVTFVDFIVHPETLNFIPYNLSFELNNKDKYFELRKALTTLSEVTSTPTENDIKRITSELGVEYKPLNFSDIELASEYYKSLSTQFDIDSTPSMVIFNHDTKKSKKLYGSAEITQENVLKNIEKLKK